jgi:hypothetical protein
MVRGLYLCKRRNRWRVRLYDGHQKVVHLSYHRTRDKAMETWLRAVAKRQLERDNATTAVKPPTKTHDLISFLRGGLSAPRLVGV